MQNPKVVINLTEMSMFFKRTNKRRRSFVCRIKTIKKREKELPADPWSSQKQTKTKSFSNNISTFTTAHHSYSRKDQSEITKNSRIKAEWQQERIIHQPIKRNNRRFFLNNILFWYGKNVDDLNQQPIYKNGGSHQIKKGVKNEKNIYI